jgi:hypothetical protein
MKLTVRNETIFLIIVNGTKIILLKSYAFANTK